MTRVKGRYSLTSVELENIKTVFTKADVLWVIQSDVVKYSDLIVLYPKDVVVSYTGKRPLILELVQHHLDKALMMVLRYTTDVNATDDKGNSLLHVLAARPHVSVEEVKRILAQIPHVDRSIKNNDGKTAQMIANEQRRYDVSKLLQTGRQNTKDDDDDGWEREKNKRATKDARNEQRLKRMKK